jgi:hypothetical protein
LLTLEGLDNIYLNKSDELVKSRETPSPSMGEGWGEGE